MCNNLLQYSIGCSLKRTKKIVFFSLNDYKYEFQGKSVAYITSSFNNKLQILHIFADRRKKRLRH